MRVLRAVRRYLLLAAAFCVFDAHLSTATAQERHRVQLDLVADRSAMCFSAEALSAGVAARLGYDPFASESNIVVETRVDRRARSRFVASITLRDGARVLGRRELEARSCESLASLLELAVSVAVDPLTSTERDVEASSEDASNTPPSAELPNEPWPSDEGRDWLPQFDRDWLPAPSESESTSVQDDDSRARMLLGGGVHVASGTAPSLGFGADFVVGAAWDWFSLRVEARGDLPASKSVDGGRVRAVFSSLSVLPCVRASVFDFCALVRGGILWSTGLDFRQSRSFTSGVFEVGLRVHAGIPVAGGWEISVYADASYAAVRTVLLVDNTEVWRNSPAIFLAGIGPLYRFP